MKPRIPTKEEKAELVEYLLKQIINMMKMREGILKGLLKPDFDTNRYILTGVRGRGSLNCIALWISCLDTWPKILDTYMAKIDLKCPQLLLYCYV